MPPALVRLVPYSGSYTLAVTYTHLVMFILILQCLELYTLAREFSVSLCSTSFKLLLSLIEIEGLEAVNHRSHSNRLGVSLTSCAIDRTIVQI